MDDDKKLDKFMVFKIADYSLCLPIRDVLKVVSFTTEISREMKTMGLVQLGKHAIKVWDLHQQLGDGSLQESPIVESPVSLERG
ncbi:hypothetical protein [Moorena producens]|uniref:hypothetical protein n=1 Tax=Moorena producens TaxID=1155739 RepID=UPI003C741502